MKTTGFITIIAVFITALLLSCEVWGVRGDGNVKRETRNVPSFNAIEAGGAFDLVISQGASQSLIIESDDNILPLIRTEVVGNTLKIDNRKPIQHATKLKIYITVVELNRVDVSGAVEIESEGRINVPELTLSGSGASETKMDLAVQKLMIDVSGGSKIRLSGTAEQASLDASGAVDLFAYELLTQKFDIHISGAGKAQINVAKELNAEISGAASVTYKGEPTQVMQDVSGAGSVKKAI